MTAFKPEKPVAEASASQLDLLSHLIEADYEARRMPAEIATKRNNVRAEIEVGEKQATETESQSKRQDAARTVR